jgi:hypothetical protein
MYKISFEREEIRTLGIIFAEAVECFRESFELIASEKLLKNDELILMINNLEGSRKMIDDAILTLKSKSE